MAPVVGRSQNLETLMSRRHRIIAMTQRGWSAREIARELGISVRTVVRHRTAHWHGRLPQGSGPKPR